jgi:hypothetical protein
LHPAQARINARASAERKTEWRGKFMTEPPAGLGWGESNSLEKNAGRRGDDARKFRYRGS